MANTLCVGGFDAMTFFSILYETTQAENLPPKEKQPEYFRDLNLDQVVEAIAADKQEYELRPFFYARPAGVETITYRHDIMCDLQRDSILRCIKSFAVSMHGWREQHELEKKLYYKEQKQRWFLHAVETYCNAVLQLEKQLSALAPLSKGLLEFCAFLSAYARSDRFVALDTAARQLTDDLQKIQFFILIGESRLAVRPYTPLPDYSAEIEEVFAKFQQGDAEDYLISFEESKSMNHIEAKALEFVVRLHPELFERLEKFCDRYREYADPVIRRFDREIQFYVSYLDYIEDLVKQGLEFCYPSVSDDRTPAFIERGFDIALAKKLASGKSSVVTNDFRLDGEERIIVVSGPNQGGKTTFSRMFGQLHHLANIGLPVPGRAARLALYDEMFTHFEREEQVANLQGKLQNDLARIRLILENVSWRSIVIMNEIFSSTSTQDAISLGSKVISRIVAIGALCVCVTFLDELAMLGPEVVSMVSQISPDNPALRTFKVIRHPPDGRSYAISIAEKYNLTYEKIVARLDSRSKRADEPPSMRQPQ